MAQTRRRPQMLLHPRRSPTAAPMIFTFNSRTAQTENRPARFFHYLDQFALPVFVAYAMDAQVFGAGGRRALELHKLFSVRHSRASNGQMKHVPRLMGGFNLPTRHPSGQLQPGPTVLFSSHGLNGLSEVFGASLIFLFFDGAIAFLNLLAYQPI